MHRIRLIWRFLADAWEAGAPCSTCRLCRSPLDLSDVIVCEACMQRTSDDIIRQRLGELDVREVIGMARGLALRSGEHVLAQALHDILILHLTGALPDAWPKLAPPETPQEKVN